MTTKHCYKCQLVKSASEFKKNRNLCKKCDQAKETRRRQRGLEILQKLATIQGHCQNCERSYTNDEWHFFEFDHVDAKLKKHNYETNVGWVASNEKKFWETVVPNLHLLCVKCHKLKTSKENKDGGAIHQKKHGQSKPAEVIDFGWNLFNPTPTPEADDYVSWSWSLVRRESDWIVQRDIDGRIINFELAK